MTVSFHKRLSHSYADSNDKAEKSGIISSIIETVRSASKDGGFIKMDKRTGQWWEVGTFCLVVVDVVALGRAREKNPYIILVSFFRRPPGS
jgi:hypothetical protein